MQDEIIDKITALREVTYSVIFTFTAFLNNVYYFNHVHFVTCPDAFRSVQEEINIFSSIASSAQT